MPKKRGQFIVNAESKYFRTPVLSTVNLNFILREISKNLIIYVVINKVHIVCKEIILSFFFQRKKKEKVEANLVILLLIMAQLRHIQRAK